MEATIEKIGFQTCLAYKDSGVEWLGEIPESWEVKRLKFLFTIRKQIAGELGHKILSITQRGIKIKDTESGEGQLSMDYSKYQVVNKGDFAMNHMDLLTGYVDISNYDGVMSPDYRVFVNKDSHNYDAYLLRLLQVCYAQKVFYAHGQGVSMLGRWRFPTENFNNFLFPIPPLSEQTAIANFLDQKTALIDKAIQIKEKQIALLQERRQILIQQAVTRGLDPNAPLKDSGVDWIGMIPEGWEVKRLASFGKFSKGGGFSKADLTEVGVSAILYGDIYTKYEIEIIKGVRFISIETAKKSIELKKGNLLFTGSGETMEDIGKCVVFSSEERTVAGGDVIIFEQHENDNLFLSFVLNTEGVKFEKARHSKGEIIVHTYGSKLRNIYIPVPRVEEQLKIAGFIKNASLKINVCISIKEKEIEKLKEYKAILINSAVTGKIKVTGE